MSKLGQKQSTNRNFLLVVMISNFRQFYSLSVAIFGVLFFYELFDKNIFLAILPIAVQFLFGSLLVIPLSSKIGHIGTKRALLLSIIIYILSSLPIYYFSQTESIFAAWIWILVYAVGDVIFRSTMIYDYSRTTSHNHRGSEMAIKHITLTATRVLTPIVAGFILSELQFFHLIFIASVVISLAFFPIMSLKDYYYTLNFGKRKWLKLKNVRRIFHNTLIAEIGTQGGRYLWIIFLFNFLGAYDTLGSLLTFSTAFSILALYLLGRFLNTHNRSKYLKLTFILYSFGYILRGIPLIPPFLVETIARIIKVFKVEAYEVVNYDLMTDDSKPSEIDEFVAIREVIALSTSGFAALLAATLGYFFGLQPALIVIGVILFGITVLMKKN